MLTRGGKPAQPGDDVTAALMHETVGGRPLGDEDASILRNWTVGEVGTTRRRSASWSSTFATRSEQDRLRARPELLPAAIDEILRIHGPLVANRRDPPGRRRGSIAGQRPTLVRSPRTRRSRSTSWRRSGVDRDPAANSWAGIHVCSGAQLAR